MNYDNENKENQLPRCHDLGTHRVNPFDNNCCDCLCGGCEVTVESVPCEPATEPEG